MVFLFDRSGNDVEQFVGTATEEMLATEMKEGLVAARITFPPQFLMGKTFRSLVFKSPQTGQYIAAYVETASKPV